MAQPHTSPSSTTRDTEAAAVRVDHGADRPPTAEEERLAESNSVDPEVAESFKAANERGAAQKGEGRVS